MSKYDHDTIQDVISIGLRDGSGTASRHTGVPGRTVRRILSRYNSGYRILSSDGLITIKEQDEDGYTLPVIPPEDLPVEEMLDQREKAFIQKKKHFDALEWFRVDMHSNEPIMVVNVGDPHLDDDGCNIPLIKRDVKIFKKPGVFAVNIGDTTNNWSGKLARLYSEQETSMKTGVRFGIWFTEQARWLVWIRGNHDRWTPPGAIELHAKEITNVAEWQAKFVIAFPNGEEVRFNTAHHFKGNSMYNRLHGGLRKAKFSGVDADVYVSGHTHEWGVAIDEHDDTHKIAHIIKVRGYKTIDGYASQGGFGQQHYGSSVGVVIDPSNTGPNRITVWPDIEGGAKYLEFLRGGK